MLDFEVFLFQLRLSFRRMDEFEEGVVGSSGLEATGGVSVFWGLVNFWARGPLTRVVLESRDVSMVVKSPLVLDLGM